METIVEAAEAEAEATELELFIQYQLEQERQDQHDLKQFYEMKQEEENNVKLKDSTLDL